MDSAPDDSLISEAVAGNDRAYEQLVFRYQDRLIHSLEHTTDSREDALEIAQQAFIQAWRKLDTFRQESQFYSWLYRIARNVAVSRSRKNRLNSNSLEAYSDATGFEATSNAAPSDRIERSEQINSVRSALSQIPEDFRQPLVLKEIDGLSYEEISQLLDIPMGTVRSRIYRARQELTERLKRLLEDD